VRGTLAALAKETKALAVAPIPVAEASERLDRWLTALAGSYDPAVLIFSTPEYMTPSPDTFAPYKLTPLLATLPAWREALHARLTASYAALPASVPSGDRPALAASLAQRRRALEVEEEAIVLRAQRQGLELARRADADAAVVLCVVLKD
jgi:hypothetical protein